ncbi:PIG-L family deacetylase [Qingshengfaniella alkalisoli]|uniref:PIG-L family deacetylase n=1 Tax=Qingshengfaniella alkalisoli TaxID=2599296 RepID=A0A5B8I9N9_9RHOB|nr:PIG-L family deacetylase [Qingshengfaniella alkalisoli]QDY70669.1 PIG-L family deacetylase [Qingshengfaniella alkalisoli]
MPLTDRDRISRAASKPRIVDLWNALQSLKSLVSFMNSGAHPDDEISAMLAALRLRDGVSVSVACANRGEGGQNDIGTEATRDLGTLRTAEMEKSAAVLDIHLYWLSEHPDDTIFDFGFSKSGVETLAKWGRQRTLTRFVEIVRTERPDILCPTFLDVPGQHGHHRAMTQLAHEIMDAAADPGFQGVDLPVWQVAKLYLPAWSGTGSSYDDEVPPPPATVVVDGLGHDPVSGWTWEQTGQQSRWYHATQGMGHWIAEGQERNWPLHLVRSEVGDAETTIMHGLPSSLADLGEAASLSTAQLAIDAAINAFPNRAEIRKHAFAALAAIDASRSDVPPEHQHRLARKRQQLSKIIYLASELQVSAALENDVLRPGDQTGVMIEYRPDSDLTADVSMQLPGGWHSDGNQLTVSDTAPPTDPYPTEWDPHAPSLPALRISMHDCDTRADVHIPLDVPPVILPTHSVHVDPTAAIVNLSRETRRIELKLRDLQPAGAGLTADLPAGWTSKITDDRLEIELPDDVNAGRYEIPLSLDGHPISFVRHIAYPHIDPRMRSWPAVIQIAAAHITLPDTRIAYVGGGNDRVPYWLRMIGLNVTELDDTALSNPETLAAFDTLLIGLFAFRTRPTLSTVRDRLQSWVKQGGNLVTLYHRPRDNWDPDHTPPKRIEIGQPSLRWRVTDETAAVTMLARDHPLMTTPNRIDDIDWTGWDKERGLYFAKSWDTAYTPLLSMNDPDESPHEGALLSARIGRGRHTHCALVLHHQMENLVPGAFRLMANLLSA